MQECSGVIGLAFGRFPGLWFVERLVECGWQWKRETPLCARRKDKVKRQEFVLFEDSFIFVGKADLHREREQRSSICYFTP